MDEQAIKIKRQEFQLHKKGYEDIVQAIKEIPEPQEIKIPNPKEVDLTETNRLLNELIEESKKKEEFEVEIDNNLRDKLKGDKGDRGDSYILTDSDKKDIAKSIDVPVVKQIVEKTEVVHEIPIVKEVAQKISGGDIVDMINDLPLTNDNKIDAKHIKNLRSSVGIIQRAVGGSSSNIDVSNFELELARKTTGNSYMEYTTVADDITEVNYWLDSSKEMKLFTKDITYSSGNPTVVTILDEETGKTLTTTINYSGDEIINVTKIVT